MSRKAKGTSVRKTALGQLEWTMLPKKKPKKWAYTKTGEKQKRALQAAFNIVQNLAESPWAKRNPNAVGFCWNFIRNPKARTDENASEIMRFLREIKRKRKDVQGQRIIDLDNPDATLPF